MSGRRFDDVWAALVEACGGVCVICGGTPVERDHIILRSRGGAETLMNTQPLCPGCNSGKGLDNTDYRPTGWQKRFVTILREKIGG